MDLFRARASKSRYVALAAVIGLHVLLLLIAQRISTTASFDLAADKALVWLRLDRPIETPRPEETPKQKEIPARPPPAPRQSPAPAETPPRPEPPPTISAP